MNTGTILPRVFGAGRLFAYRGAISFAAAGVFLALTGCATDVTTGEIPPADVVEKIELLARIDALNKERRQRFNEEEEKDRRAKLAREVEVDIAKIVGNPTCYSGDVRDLDGLAEKIRSHEAGGPHILSLSETTETWRRAYGTGGGGGGC